MLMLFESLCTVCSAMFRQWIWKKINEIKKSHAHHIYVAYETVGLLSWISSCWTIELSDYRSDPVQPLLTVYWISLFLNIYGLLQDYVT